MTEYIEREAFLEQKRKQYCEDCSRRKGMKGGKYKTLYEIGEAPCRACEINDVLNDVEDFPAADVRPVVRGKWHSRFYYRESTKAYDCEMHVCSECGSEWSYDAETGSSDFNFCPNCGAMIEES